jgi:hypothetical protein
MLRTRAVASMNSLQPIPVRLQLEAVWSPLVRGRWWLGVLHHFSLHFGCDLLSGGASGRQLHDPNVAKVNFRTLRLQTKVTLLDG